MERLTTSISESRGVVMASFARLRRYPRTTKIKIVATALFTLWALDQTGVFALLMQTSYTKFSYPLEFDSRELLSLLEAGRKPPYTALNSYEDYRFKIRNELKCKGPNLSVQTSVRLVLIIKSAVPNRRKRDAIRRSWGFENRFTDVQVRRVFVVGVTPENPTVQDSLDEEYVTHGDIVQADFVDTYYNNTIKTMLGYRWVTEYCPNAEFALFVDDDYYVSLKNLLRFVRNPWGFSAASQDGDYDRKQRRSSPDGRLWAGYVFPHSIPMRHRWSKWYISLAEYPFSRYPPYVTAGAYVLSSPAVRDLYRVAQYTRQFRFDDIFLGIVAQKARLRPLHSDAFRYYGKPSERADFVGLIASHGFSDPDELVSVWEKQKSYGQA